MAAGQQSHTVSTLASGKILVAGGYYYDGSSYCAYFNTSELYKSSTGFWTKTGNMTMGRTGHIITLFSNGKVLVICGYIYDIYYNSRMVNNSGQKNVNMSTERYLHTNTLWMNGKVLVAGGYGGNEYNCWGLLNSAEIYDPSAGIWTKGDNMTMSRIAHTASLLSNEKVLVIGGTGYNGTLNSAELYS
ncbi:unnamed protein product [Rotaria socialis]|uniref:Uncharacterized protein n=1 Tax=Rotaria socialis TaxID=392032 RepID=A0A820TJE1_9BILA|nr:unnamed protein product [Rotaria socialis]CAF3345123.1 unnamed protein product [Rotaria socialis]CAF3361089.1 unnamed protein product [Rotaria socialis]CAF3468668.1 unnamed protein product [Rotaria socialis]CAF3476584.1 unnamed protein product [Rotaria socialis]